MPYWSTVEEYGDARLSRDESILTTCVDVMSYESTLENFETALKGDVFAMVYKVLLCRH